MPKSLFESFEKKIADKKTVDVNYTEMKKAIEKPADIIPNAFEQSPGENVVANKETDNSLVKNVPIAETLKTEKCAIISVSVYRSDMEKLKYIMKETGASKSGFFRKCIEKEYEKIILK